MTQPRREKWLVRECDEGRVLRNEVGPVYTSPIPSFLFRSHHHIPAPITSLTATGGEVRDRSRKEMTERREEDGWLTGGPA